MVRSSNLLGLPSDEWRRLDQWLDELLDLDAAQRQSRLDQIAADFPEQAARLKRLLAIEPDEPVLEVSLHAALNFLAERDPVPENTRIGAWRLGPRIGQGGMAEVYRAERADGAYRQTVALKLLWPGLTGDEAGRFVRQERQILAALDDSRIARLIDGGLTEEGRPWLAMEHVAGEPITRYCRQHQLSRTQRLKLLINVAEAVALAHRQLIVHGDIKSANVLVTEKGQIKLLDFGIGKLLDDSGGTDGSGSGWKALTPDCASPEQRKGRPPTPASDVFQLGLLLREVMVDAHAGWQPPDRQLRAIIRRALQSSPAERYGGADLLAADLRALIEHRPVDARNGGALYRARCFLRRQWPGVSLTMIVLAAAVIAAFHQLDQARRLAAESAANAAVLTYLEDMLKGGGPQPGNRPRIPGRLLEDAAARLNTEMIEHPRARARVLNVLGDVHLARAEGLQARQRHQEALDLAIRHGLSEASDRSRAGLAAVGIFSGDYAWTEVLLRDLLTERLERFGADSPKVAAIRLQLADQLHSRGYYRQALAVAEPARQSGHFSAWSARVVGMINRDRGQFRQARIALEQAVDLERSDYRRYAASLAATLEHSALLDLHQGRFDQAQSILNESLAIRRALLGPNWEGLLWTRHWQALSHFAEGRFEQAGELLDITISDYQRSFAASSHLLAFARSDRGWVALATGDIASARQWFSAAIEGLEAVQSGDHPRLAEPLMGRALVELALGQTMRARQSAKRAHAIRRHHFGNTPEALTWLTTACQVLRLANGSCPLPETQSGATTGLDRLRLHHALDAMLML